MRLSFHLTALGMALLPLVAAAEPLVGAGIRFPKAVPR